MGRGVAVAPGVAVGEGGAVSVGGAVAVGGAVCVAEGPGAVASGAVGVRAGGAGGATGRGVRVRVGGTRGVAVAAGRVAVGRAGRGVGVAAGASAQSAFPEGGGGFLPQPQPSIAPGRTVTPLAPTVLGAQRPPRHSANCQNTHGVPWHWQ
jgi:hypothetical protein